MVGAAVAALLLAAISAGLQIVGVDPTWYQVVLGISILLAVAFHKWSDRFVDRNILQPASEGSPGGTAQPGTVPPDSGAPTTPTLRIFSAE